MSSQLTLKLVRLAKLLEIDSQTATRQSNLTNLPLVDESPAIKIIQSQSASCELADFAQRLLLMMPTTSGGLKPDEKRASFLMRKQKVLNPTIKLYESCKIDEEIVDDTYCKCQEKYVN